MLIPKNICFRKFINWERKGNFKNKAIQMRKKTRTRTLSGIMLTQKHYKLVTLLASVYVGKVNYQYNHICNIIHVYLILNLIK